MAPVSRKNIIRGQVIKPRIIRAKGRTIKPGTKIVPVWVPRKRVEQAWPLVEKFVEDAVRHAGGRFTAEDIRKFCLNGQMQLWLVLDDGQATAVVLTEIVNYPQKKSCRIVGLAGHNMHKWLNLRIHIDEWAKRNGCQKMEIIGREGWARLFPDWSRKTFLEKDLD